MAKKIIFTDDQRRLVRKLTGLGVKQDDIANILRIHSNTLRRCFKEELTEGIADANIQVAESLFKMATKGRNVTAAIFWAKTRMKWRERVEPQEDARNITLVERVIIDQKT